MDKDTIAYMIDYRNKKYKTYLMMVNGLDNRTIDAELISSISAIGDEIVSLQNSIEIAIGRRMEHDDEEEYGSDKE